VSPGNYYPEFFRQSDNTENATYFRKQAQKKEPFTAISVIYPITKNETIKPG
jgi:hypothetical protein